jgi:hypothetical protein
LVIVTARRRRPSNAGSRGLYRRRRHAKNGKTLNAGAYILDMRLKKVPEFAGLKLRLARTTEVYPTDRNAATIVREMKQMVKELIRDRDADTLKKIQSGAVSIPSAYQRWKQGRIHLAYGHEDQPIVKRWREYYRESSMAEITRVNRFAIIDALINHGLLSEKHVVAELPEILERIRDHYSRAKQHAIYNQVRQELLQFMLRKLRIEEGTPFHVAVRKIPPLPVLKRKEHHPFHSPRECYEFYRRMRRRKAPRAEDYADAVLFMCLHGLRPEEFARGNFERDPKTGHLWIKGTKNPNADRVVPRVWAYKHPRPYPRIETLNRLFERMGIELRCRDFRKTFAIWCEQVGFTQSQIRLYMGHAGKEVTHTYQRVRPRQADLDEHAERMRRWFETQAITKAPRRQKVEELSMENLDAKVRRSRLDEARAHLAEEERRSKPFPWEQD